MLWSEFYTSTVCIHGTVRPVASPAPAPMPQILPATLNYRGYSKACCTSINHVVCHGIPNDKPLRNGEIVNIDVSFVVDGWHGDSSRMYAVGEIPRAAERLIDFLGSVLAHGCEGIVLVGDGETRFVVVRGVAQHQGEGYQQRCRDRKDQL